MSAIIAEKQIVVKAIDKVTEPVAQMNQRLTNLVHKFESLDQRMQAGASGQQSFKASLNEVKASASETAEALNKIHDKKVEVKADTGEANAKVSEFDKKVAELGGRKPVVKPEVNDSQANEKLTRFQRIMQRFHSPLIKPKMDTTQVESGAKRVENVGHSLTKSFVFGGMITNGINAVANDLKNWATQGFEAAKSGAEVAERWKNLGMTDKQVKQVGASVKELKENSNLSGQAVGNLVTRFYGFTGSVARARELATGVGSLADKMKLSGEQADAFANGLTRIETSGKVTTQSLGRLERSAPGLTKALQQASGMSKKSFDELLSSGKMTSDQFNDILAKASKDWKENSSEWNKTADGALHHMQVEWADTKKALMAPLVKVSATGLSALSKALDNKETQHAITQLGQGIANVAKAMANWLTPQHARDLVTMLESLTRIAGVIAKGAWKSFELIIRALTAPFRLLSGSTGKTGDGFDKLADGLDHISKNKIAMTVLEGIGGILMTQFAYGKLFKIADALGLVDKGLLSIGRVKFRGHLFKDLENGLQGLSKFKINPANWFKGANFSFIGKGIATKLAGGISIGLGAVDILRGLTGSHIHNRAKMIGKGVGTIAGTAAGMALTPVLGPFGPIVGSMLGGAIGGKIGPGVSKAFKGAINFFKDILKGDWSGAFSGIAKGFKSMWKNVTGWAKDTWKKVKDWWNGTDTSDSKSSSSKSSEPSQKKIRSLGGNHYSKTDIANVKEMNRAIIAYTQSLKTLKQVIKRNDPTKQLNTMNKRLKAFVKELQKEIKPLNKASKDFKTFGKATKTMASSIKSLTGKHGLGEFDKDISKLDKDMKHSKVGEYFERLAKSIKKSKLADEFKSLTKYLTLMVKDWEHLVKPLKSAEKEFQNFEKVISKLSNRKTGLSKVDTDLKTLSKDLVKYNFAKTLSKQMQEANKAVGKHGFVKQFDGMVRSVEADLKSFNKAFSREWDSVWRNLDRDVRRALNRADEAESRGFSSLRSTESRFASGFRRSWNSWLNSVVSAFRSGFNRLPGIASRSMSEIVSRLNRGISGINKVISDFGGDKKLGTISYAHGTLVHPGGKAIINDGLTPNKTELVYQPSKGWSTAVGQNVVRDLEVGSMVIDAPHSTPILGRIGSMIPHYASGTLSDDEMDKIAESFMDNPVVASRNLMLKLTNWSSSVPLIPSFGKSLAIGFSRGIANVLKDLLGIIKEPINGDWTPVIKSAFRVLHMHPAPWMIAKFLKQIQTESGGNEGAIGGTDGLPDGHATGLLQFKPGTFRHWAVAPYDHIMKGFDQIVTAIRVLMAGGEGGWSNFGMGHGWANGGHITSEMLGRVGDNAEHDEYVINPYNSQSIPLMRDALKTMENVHPELRSTSTSTAFNAQVVELLKETVTTIKNLHLQPVLPVDETRRMISKKDAHDYALMKG
ncbi:phage tape measure protein [Limosilactobacillus frumenti DSM 13145]|uniref:Phage tape measure protein n=1 Tax=Limosilactobacillus frumenti DSM 13145 TaxID=1423746 RepID=A0A0R1P4K0_9LACO|nr:tape measure protein [Limosilactobacillus frumenti]KRL27318.1 phage tape measure protein [Limosilactobacillus frumenti DSM 13145]QFG72764.1 tape measure protein [Limosilactobacillus frumenti]